MTFLDHAVMTAIGFCVVLAAGALLAGVALPRDHCRDCRVWGDLVEVPPGLETDRWVLEILGTANPPCHKRRSIRAYLAELRAGGEQVGGGS